MSLIIFTLILASLAFLFYTYLIHPLFLHPLSKIPTVNPTAAISSLWIRYHRRGGRTAFRLLLTAHNKLGPVIRLSPNELSVASLDGLRKIYLGGFEKTEWYMDEFMNYQTPNLVCMLSSKPHATQKRMISHVYSKSYIQNSADVKEIGEAVSERLISVLRGFVKENTAVNVYALNQAIGADFTSAFLFGGANCTEFIRNSAASERYFENWRVKIRREAGKDKATAEIEDFVLSLCRQADSSISTPQDLSSTSTSPVVLAQLSSSLSKSPEKGLGGKRELVIASEMMDQLGAGAETIKVTFTYLQWELSRRPKLQVALREELLTLTPPFKFTLGHEPQHSLNSKGLDTLPLLGAILKETQRLYPPTPSLLTRLVPQNGTTIDGYEIPAGVVVGTSGFVMHMNEDVFPDASSFKPERWLVDGPVKVEMNRWFWVFGSGGRMCVGSHFAIYSEFCSSFDAVRIFQQEIIRQL
jgi:cytochrome P450